MKTLAPSAGERFATARDLQLALEDFARSRQLRFSSVGLSEYMSSLFPSQVGAWDLARRSGQSLIEYVTSMMVTRMTSSGVTRRDGSSWFRRWAPAIALLAAGVAVAGWVVAFSRDKAGREKPGAAAVTQPAGGPAGTPATPAKTAPPKPDPKVTPEAPNVVPAPIDASPIVEVDATSAGDAAVVAFDPKNPKKRPPKPKPPKPPDAVVPTTPPGLDDRLNPFRPPGKGSGS